MSLKELRRDERGEVPSGGNASDGDQILYRDRFKHSVVPLNSARTFRKGRSRINIPTVYKQEWERMRATAGSGL